MEEFLRERGLELSPEKARISNISDGFDFIGVVVPRRFRARFRQEWEAELEYREELPARWDRLD